MGLVQCVEEPTRGDNILDLALVNDPLLIASYNVTAPFGSSDHETVEFNLVLPVVEADTECVADSKYCFNFKEADYDGLNDFLSNVDWLTVLGTDSARDANTYKFGVIY